MLHWANCWDTGVQEKNKQIRTEVSSQGKYSALRDVYFLNVAYKALLQILLRLSKIEGAVRFYAATMI